MLPGGTAADPADDAAAAGPAGDGTAADPADSRAVADPADGRGAADPAHIETAAAPSPSAATTPVAAVTRFTRLGRLLGFFMTVSSLTMPDQDMTLGIWRARTRVAWRHGVAVLDGVS
jgi:hypothetical protein